MVRLPTLNKKELHKDTTAKIVENYLCTLTLVQTRCVMTFSLNLLCCVRRGKKETTFSCFSPSHMAMHRPSTLSLPSYTSAYTYSVLSKIQTYLFWCKNQDFLFSLRNIENITWFVGLCSYSLLLTWNRLKKSVTNGTWCMRNLLLLGNTEYKLTFI